jgi:hypothetical protein
METKAGYSTGTHTCAEMAESALARARRSGEPLGLINPPIELAVEAIIADICDRRGLKNEWYGIDADVQGEIKHVWGIIIEDALASEGKEE